MQALCQSKVITAVAALACAWVASAYDPNSRRDGVDKRARNLADAWLAQQGMAEGAETGPVGSWETVPGAPDMNASEAFRKSSEKSFPESEIEDAVRKTAAGTKGSNERKRSKNFKSSPNAEPLERSSRELGGNYYATGSSPYDGKVSLSEGPTYDWFSQGYRMLGAFIDCDHTVYNTCSRWMMWAAYINPNYQGGGWDEYYGYTGGSDGEDIDYTEYNENLDCHNDNTEWLLLGVYRMELYQFIEQLSKHVWEIDSWEYYAVTAAMSYMTVYDCYEIDNGYFGGPKPVEGGYLAMGVYSDEYCLTLVEDVDFDDYSEGYNGGGRNLKKIRKLSEDENEGGGGEGDEWPNDGTPESSLTYLNNVLDTFKMCRLCMDYPTYQDGYFIGDYGTDDYSIINQCWKFHSHNSYYCSGGCVMLGHKQGTITNLMYGGQTLGHTSSYSADNSGGGSSATKQIYDPVLSETIEERLKSNVFVTFSGVLFISTCIMYYVAKGSTPTYSSMRSKKLLKSKRLLEKLAATENDDQPSMKIDKSKSDTNNSTDEIYKPPEPESTE